MTTQTDEEKRDAAVKDILRRHERKAEIAAYMLQYRKDHKDEIAEKRRQYEKDHKEEVAESSHQYYQKHVEERLQYVHQHNKENVEKMREAHCRYRTEHPEEAYERGRQYRLTHPEVGMSARRKRRALLAGSNGNFTAEEFKFLCEVYENKCVYCHEELPLIPDHSIPLSRGGSNSIENIVPSCAICNLKKHTMTYDEYIEHLSVKAND